MKQPPFRETAVKAVFDGYPAKLHKPLLELRRLIFETAAETDAVGELVETLKWGQPAYLTARPKTGSTIRLGTLKGDALKGKDAGYALFFHCQTTLVPTFQELYPDSFAFQGKRALIFAPGDELPREELKHCIALALTYHARPRLL